MLVEVPVTPLKQCGGQSAHVAPNLSVLRYCKVSEGADYCIKD
jgi:hypothetical protein